MHPVILALVLLTEGTRESACIALHIHTYMHACKHTWSLLLVLMHWHRQAIFVSKKETSCLPLVRTGLEPRCLSNPFSIKLNTRSQTDWAIEDQAKDLNSVAHPYDERAFSPLDTTAGCFRTWLWQYTWFFLLIVMLWHRQAIIESEGDHLPFSAECRIRRWEVFSVLSVYLKSINHSKFGVALSKPRASSHNLGMVHDHFVCPKLNTDQRLCLSFNVIEDEGHFVAEDKINKIKDKTNWS